MVKILPEQERIARYDAAYFTERNCREINAYHQRHLRADQWAALGYAWGSDSYETICRALQTDPKERWTKPTPVADHTIVAGTRVPTLVIDVGAGRCELACTLQSLGATCIAIEPSPDAQSLLADTVAKWHLSNVALLNVSMLQGLRRVLDMGAHPDTIVFCESIEHIPSTEFLAAWPVVHDLLTPNGLCIITNWLDNHPIRPDRTGYDHITRIDDDLYDRLAGTAQETVFREGSHLVLRF